MWLKSVNPAFGFALFLCGKHVCIKSDKLYARVSLLHVKGPSLYVKTGGLIIVEEKVNSYLKDERVEVLMRKYSIPCIISLLVAAIYNIVDQLFIANADYLGSYGNAGNTVVFPLMVFALAIAVLIGDGCCAFVSICLGSDQKERAHKSIGNSIIICIAVSILVTVIYLVFMDPLLELFGGRVNEQTYECSKEYFFYIALGLPFYMFGQAMNPIIRSDGSPKFAMVATVSGAIVNVIFDPVFIFGFKWGMMGAAVATVMGQILTAVLSIWYLFHMKAIKLEKKSFPLRWDLIKKILPLGATSFLAQLSLVLSMLAVQKMVVKYGALDEIFGQNEYAQIPLAVIGIVMKIFQIVISVAIGLAAGCIPIVGYNIGAGREDRAKKLFTLLLKVEAVVGLVAIIIAECFPKQLANLFGAQNESIYYTEYAVKCFRIFLCTMILACINKGTVIYLQALGKALISTILSMLKEIVFGVGLPILLPVFFGLDGILYFMPLSDILTFIVTAVVIAKTYKELNERIEKRNLTKS